MSLLSPTSVEKEEVIFTSKEIPTFTSLQGNKSYRKSNKGDVVLLGMFMYFMGLVVIGIVTLLISLGGGDFGDGLLAACLIPSIFGFLILSSSSK